MITQDDIAAFEPQEKSQGEIQEYVNLARDLCDEALDALDHTSDYHSNELDDIAADLSDIFQRLSEFVVEFSTEQYPDFVDGDIG